MAASIASLVPAFSRFSPCAAGTPLKTATGLMEVPCSALQAALSEAQTPSIVALVEGSVSLPVFLKRGICSRASSSEYSCSSPSTTPTWAGVISEWTISVGM